MCFVCHESLVGTMKLTLPCGHMGCAGCLAQWMASQPTCPMCRKTIGKDNQKMCQGLTSASAAADSKPAASSLAESDESDLDAEADSDSDSETESRSQHASASVAVSAPHFLPDPNYQPEPEEADFKYTFPTEEKSRFGSGNGWWAFYPQAGLPPSSRPAVPSAQWIAAYERRVGVHDYVWYSDALADIGYVQIGDAVRVMVTYGDPVAGMVKELVRPGRFSAPYVNFVSPDGKCYKSDVASLQVLHDRKPLD